MEIGLLKEALHFVYNLFGYAKSEERSQSLAMLMLQFCAGYQSCVEAEEQDMYQL